MDFKCFIKIALAFTCFTVELFELCWKTSGKEVMDRLLIILLQFYSKGLCKDDKTTFSSRLQEPLATFSWSRTREARSIKPCNDLQTPSSCYTAINQQQNMKYSSSTAHHNLFPLECLRLKRIQLLVEHKHISIVVAGGAPVGIMITCNRLENRNAFTNTPFVISVFLRGCCFAQTLRRFSFFFAKNFVGYRFQLRTCRTWPFKSQWHLINALFW